jgi:hypothetical protein
MKMVRIALLLCLVPYLIWILGQDRFGPRVFFYGLVVLAILVPVIVGRIVASRRASTIASLIIAPILLYLALYIDALGDHESLMWLPIVAAWVLAITAPVWIVLSIICCSMKEDIVKGAEHPAAGDGDTRA